MGFDLKKLFVDVFHPEAGERVVVVRDAPTEGIEDNALWVERREMAAEWRDALAGAQDEIGLQVADLVTYPGVGAHNGDLPLDSGDPVSLREALSCATIGLALTEFSPTAPMVAWSNANEDFRCATLPGVARRTEGTALSADYGEVARRCLILRDQLDAADAADVVFSTGHEWHVDLRHRKALMDDGQLPRDKVGRVINLPSGESFQVPYEGEIGGDASETEGEVPVPDGGDTLIYHIRENRVQNVSGGQNAASWKSYFEQDRSRSNIAEFAFGCNPEAVVWDNVLEDEKAGFHWAYGRSEHLGGTVGPADFKGPDTIVHQDIVYAPDSPIQVVSVKLIGPEGAVEVIRDGTYSVF
jgi:hypothetical protein